MGPLEDEQGGGVVQIQGVDMVSGHTHGHPWNQLFGLFPATDMLASLLSTVWPITQCRVAE